MANKRVSENPDKIVSTSILPIFEIK